MDNVERKRIAVIGSGIAGLTNAFLLSHKHDVVVYEAAATLGMDQSGITLDERFANGDFEPNNDDRHPTIGDSSPSSVGKKCVRVDVPLRVFTESYYPHLTGLYQTVGVEYRAEDYSSSFSAPGGAQFFTYSNLLMGKFSFPYALPWRQHASFWPIARDVIRFLRHSPAHLADGTLASTEITLLHYLQQQNYSRQFIYRFMLPSFAAIATCSLAAAARYPARVVVHYLATRAWQGVRRAKGGAEDVVHKLVKRCEAVRLGCRVVAVQNIRNTANTASAVSASVKVFDCAGGSDVFDAVVFATQANQTLAILRAESPAHAHADAEAEAEAEADEVDASASRAPLEAALATVKYERSRLVVHTDARLMPTQRAAWRSVNFVLPDALADAEALAQGEEGPAKAKKADCPLAGVEGGVTDNGVTAAGEVTAGVTAIDDPRWSACPSETLAGLASIEREGMATIWMNKVQHGLRADVDIFQTWNPLLTPAEGSVVCQHTFERPVVTAESLEALKTLWEVQGAAGVYVVGSFAIPGVPLLESAACSAVRVAALLGADCPWLDRVTAHKGEVSLDTCPPRPGAAIRAVLAVADTVLRWVVSDVEEGESRGWGWGKWGAAVAVAVGAGAGAASLMRSRR
jgi:predicted NAD/FAD-binding protein